MSSLDVTMDDSSGGAQPQAQWNQMGPAEKEASIHEEVKRLEKLPTNSTYVTHRLRVLNKILQLLSIQNYITRPGVGVAFCGAFYMNPTFLGSGGSADYNIFTRSFRDFNNSNKQEVDAKEVQADLLRLEKEFREYKELNEPCVDLKYPCTTNIPSVARQKPQDMEFAYTSNIHSVGTCKPEDVIRVFMMKEFMGRQLCHDPMVPVALRKKVVSNTSVDKMED